MPRSRRTIVCSCEDVTQSDVDAALERGYRDIESVKRFTGFGTGICQGRHCLTTVARLVTDRGLEAPAIQPTTPRPPLEPVNLGALAQALPGEEDEP